MLFRSITHSICTLEFENNRDIYDWVLDALELTPPRPYQHEFARLGMNYTVMSKRKLLELVNGNYVNGWDDPRLPTIAGYKRRGYTPESIINFCEQIGIAKANSMVDVAQLEFCIRDDLNQKVPRVMCVLDPLKVTIENYEGEEEIDASYYPHDVPKDGSRNLPFSKEIYIERDDFMENPIEGYHRLTPTQSVRLKHAYILTCKEIIKDASGNIVELKATYHPDSKSGADTSGIKTKSAIHWVSAKHAKQIEVRLYERLYKVDAPENVEDLNPDSLHVNKNAFIEPSVISEKPDVRFQFERQGYFYADPIDYTDAHPVFNKIVGLKDSWNKKAEVLKDSPKPEVKKVHIEGDVVPMSEAEKARFETYTKHGLNSEIANTLARDEQLSSFYEETLCLFHSPITLANIVANEVAREFKQGGVLHFNAKGIAQLVEMIDNETISNKIAKQVFEEMVKTGEEPKSIVEAKELRQISDPEILKPLIDDVITKNPENVAKYKAGNTNLFGFFVGLVLKQSGGKANPSVVNTLVSETLKHV